MAQLQAVDPRGFPFVGYVETTFPGTNGRTVTTLGTATLIGPKLLLTAGHVVFDSQHGGEAAGFSLVAGAGTRVAIGASDFRTTTLWRNVDSRGSAAQRSVSRGDIGVIVLDQPIDLSLGIQPLNFESAPRSALAAMDLNVAGFDAARPNSNRLFRNSFRTVSNPTLDQFSARIFYSVPTVGGMSGGPVWAYDPNTQTRTLRAVHTSGFQGFGCAMRLADSVYDIVAQWRSDFHPNASPNLAA